MSFSCADNRRYNDALVALPHNTMSTRSRSIRGALVGCLCSDGTRHLLVGSAARAGVFALWQQASVRPRRQPGSAGSAPASRRRLDAPRFGGGRRHANPSRLRSPGSLIAKGPCPRHATGNRLSRDPEFGWEGALHVERSVHEAESPSASATATATDAPGPFPPEEFRDAHAGDCGFEPQDRKARKCLRQGHHLPRGTRIQSSGAGTAASKPRVSPKCRANAGIPCLAGISATRNDDACVRLRALSGLARSISRASSRSISRRLQ